MDATENLHAALAEGVALAQAATTSDALDTIHTDFLGRAGKMTALMKTIGTLPNDKKPAFGQALNASKSKLLTAINDQKAALLANERAARQNAEAIDVTLPGRARPHGRLHPLTTTMQDIKRVMIGLGFTFVEGPDIEDYRYNFEWLNYPPDHPAMDEQMSFYVDDTHLLRTQTTALQGRIMGSGKQPPFRMATVGRCYRYENMDATHSHTFHQVDGFSVDEGISLADLKGVLAAMMRGLFGPDVTVRFRPDFFPFVEPGVEVAVKWGDPHTGAVRWLELGGAGLIHPNILARAGYDTERYTGFAFGLGIDRMPMRKYGVDDLRLFLESDLRFLQQFP